jgi:hypothetical protein
MDADGGNQHQVGDVSTDVIAPAWSPSGDAVVVVGKVGNNLSDLVVVRTDGTLAHRLTWGGWFTGALYDWINWPFVLLQLIALTGPLYAWTKWPSERRNLELPAWRRVILSVGLFTVTIQAILYLALLAPRSAVYHHDVLYDVEQRAVFFSIILVLPAFACILTWKGPARLLLLGAELSLPILCFGRAMDLFGAW